MQERWYRMAIMAALIAILVAAPISTAKGKPKIVILANSIDYDLATDLFGFLKNKGMETVHATATDFEQYKNEKFIVILGGPDAYDGVGDVVMRILSEDEQNSIREKGNRKKYVKINPWGVRPGQRVTVLAGSDRNQTKKAHQEHRGEVAEGAEEVATQVSVTIENFEFDPADINVSKGDTVIWTNNDNASHTVTELNATFDSGTLEMGNTFNYTFNEVGTFDYKCTFHPANMTGKVVVAEGSEEE